MKFYGGVLDGKEFEVGLSPLRVPVKDGVWHDPPDQVVRAYQVYEKRGEGMYFSREIRLDDGSGDGGDPDQSADVEGLVNGI